MPGDCTSMRVGIGLAVSLSLGLFAWPATGQVPRPADEWCAGERHGERARHCEVREETLAHLGPLSLDAGPNGGIRVEGWARSDTLLRAKVVANAMSDAEARQLASQVQIVTAAGQIRAEGPQSGRRENWSVSYELFVPQRADLSLETLNGGIAVRNVHGDIRFRALNGGVTLSGVGGHVRGGTTNGGVKVALEGQRWDGQGLQVRTTNGGVQVTIPEGYAARLEVGTTNGGLRFEFPVQVQGRLDRRIALDLAGGGPLIQATTVNGGVAVRRP